MFTFNHFIWMALCAALIALLTFSSVRGCFPFRKAAFLMAALTLCSELAKIMTSMVYVNGIDASEGMVINPESLPLHLCSMLFFVFLYLPFCRRESLRQRLLSFLVPISLMGAPLAILIPTDGVSFLEPQPYQGFLFHAAMIWFALYLVLTGQVDLGLRAWAANLVTLLALAFSMIWVNGALRVYNTNFFFIVRPPAENLPLLNLNHGWYAYFLTILLCGFVLLGAVYLPFIVRERRAARKSI